MQENIPVLVSCSCLKPEFKKLQTIYVDKECFTIGRGLDNLAVIPYLSISRQHCAILRKNNSWLIEDKSTCGIEINGNKLGKGKSQHLSDKDVIKLDPLGDFVFKFFAYSHNDFEIPRKKMKLECHSNIIDDVKLKFDASQNLEMQHLETKLYNTQQMQTTSRLLKEQLEIEMNRKIQQLETKCQQEVKNLKGEKDEVEKQKLLLMQERDEQLTKLKHEMGGQITELMKQIKEHNETETELLNENKRLKENLLKEREEFLAELNRESSSKQELLDKLSAKIKEQEEIRLKEKKEFQEQLQRETEQLKTAKENEIKEFEELKRIKENELKSELESFRKNMLEQIAQTEQEKLKAEQILNEQTEQIKKLKDDEKVIVEQLVKEKEEYEKKLAEAEINSNKSIEQLRNEIVQRETELAALAAERIQKNAEQSSEVISNLQEQLEKVRNQLQNVETEKNTLLESICFTESSSTGSTKDKTLTEVGQLMESELQCSICSELFVEATTLNCSHTFCKYCIDTWKKKKKECPNCRTHITSECKSLALDSFIEKMVQNLTEDMKQKREELLKFRTELESSTQQPFANNHRGSSSDGETTDSEDAELDLEEEEEGGEEFDLDDYDDYNTYDEYFNHNFRGRYYDTDSADGTDSGSDAGPDDTSLHNSTGDAGSRARRWRGEVPGVSGAYYGGYGKCYRCGAPGHWAPGCPNQ